MKDPRKVSSLVLAMLLSAGTAHAQLSGSNIPGDFGIKSGSQAPPGIYAGYLLYDYGSSKIVADNDNELVFTDGDIDAWAHIPSFR